MKKSLKILIATDFSNPAVNAERYAIQFAKATQSTLLFTNIFEPSLAGTSISFDAEKIDYSPVKYEYDKLCDHVSKLFISLNIAPSEVNHKCVVREGTSIKKQISEETDESVIDLVITGTHHTNAVHEWLFGNHTWDLIKRTEVPLLAIPENVTFADIKRIVFATEYREGEIPAIHYLTQIAQNFNAEITVLHVTNDTFPKEFEREFFNRFKKDLDKQVTYDKLSLKLIYRDHIIDGLNEYCQEHNANWLVMSPERFSLLEKLANPVNFSVTKHMTFHTQTPLLVLPDFYNVVYAEMMKIF